MRLLEWKMQQLFKTNKQALEIRKHLYRNLCI